MLRSFSEAHTTPGHGFSTLTLIALIIVLLGSLAPNSAADDEVVVLPVEFYFGRWEPGATVGSMSVFEKEAKPYWRGYGEVTDRQFRLGAEAWTGSPFPHARMFDGHGFAAGFQVRPLSTVQLGVDDLRYEDRQASLSGQPIRHDETLDIVSSCWFSTSDSVYTPRAFDQYVYAGGSAVGRGQLVGRAYGGYSRYILDGVSESMTLIDFEGRERTSHVGSEVKYGLSEWLIIQAGVFYESYRFHRYSLFFPRTTAEDTIIARLDRDRMGLNLVVAAAFSDAVLAQVALTQQYAETYSQDALYHTISADSSINVTYFTRDRSRKRERTRIRVMLSHQVRGAFDGRIVLDDYLGYYRHLLFEGQRRTSLAIEYEHRPGDDIPAQGDGLVSFDYALGLADNTEIGANATYSWRQDRFGFQVFSYSAAKESIDWSLSLRWRSFDYVPGRGPGWDRDSRADFAFGPLLPSGGVYLSFQLIPPGWSQDGYDRGGFLSFSNLEGTSNLSLAVESVVGIRGISEVGSDILFRWQTSGPGGEAYSGDASAFVRLRIAGRLEMRVAYEQYFRNPHNDPAEITLTLAGVL